MKQLPTGRTSGGTTHDTTGAAADSATGGARWILAFDGSCGRCRRISEVVEEASRGRLEVRPLADPDVRRWREQALGGAASWAPTVLAVEHGRVRAWTGPSLGLRLTQRLGPRHTIRVLRALGELRTAGASTTPDGAAGEHGLRRRGLLKLGAGVGVGLGLMLSGQAPAFAAPDPRKLSEARDWARANQTPRAGQYEEFARFEPEYRRACFGDLSPSVRRGLWTEQFARYRDAHTDLTAEQSALLDEAEALVSEPRMFSDPGPALLERVRSFEARAIEAYGRGRACGLFSRLGPAEAAGTEATGTEAAGTGSSDPMQGCQCSIGSACNEGCNALIACSPSSVGCGCFGVWACDGTYGA